MSDETGVPADEAGAETTTPVADTDSRDGDDAGDNEPLGERGKRALEAERKAREAAEKRAKQAEAKLKAFEDAQKSELQKALERAQEAERRAEEAELSALREKIAREKGVPVSALTSRTEDEMRAQADALLEWRNSATDQQQKQQQKQRTPKPGAGDLKSGASGRSETSDPKARAAEALRRLRQAG